MSALNKANHARREPNLSNADDIESLQCPLSSNVTRQLAGVLWKLDELYASGKRIFLVTSHRDPDPDSVGSFLAMRKLLHDRYGDEGFPDGVRVLFLHDGNLRQEYSDLTPARSQTIANLPHFLRDSAISNRIAVVVLDQPSLHSSHMLPPELRVILKGIDADVLIDHHGDALDKLGWVIERSAGSTSALMVALLELAEVDDYPWSYNDARHWRQDKMLCKMLAMGAHTDAGANDEESIAQLSNPVLRWLSAELKGFDMKLYQHKFDPCLAVSSWAFERLLHSLTNHGIRQVHGQRFRFFSCFAPETWDCTAPMAIFADRALRLMKSGVCNGESTVLAVVGIIREKNKIVRANTVVKGDEVYIGFRSNGIDLGEFPKRLGEGGGRPGAGAARWPLHRSIDGKSIAEFRRIFLRRLDKSARLPGTKPRGEAKTVGN